MPNTEVKLLSADGSWTDVPLEQDVARQTTFDRQVIFLWIISTDFKLIIDFNFYKVYN